MTRAGGPSPRPSADPSSPSPPPIDLRWVRTAAHVVVGLYAGAMLHRWIVDGLLGLHDGSRSLAALAVLTLLGGVVGFADGLAKAPMTLAEARDGVTGWGFVITLGAILPWLALESWAGRVAGAALTAVAGCAITVRARRRLNARGVVRREGASSAGP